MNAPEASADVETTDRMPAALDSAETKLVYPTWESRTGRRSIGSRQPSTCGGSRSIRCYGRSRRPISSTDSGRRTTGTTDWVEKPARDP